MNLQYNPIRIYEGRVENFIDLYRNKEQFLACLEEGPVRKVWVTGHLGSEFLVEIELTGASVSDAEKDERGGVTIQMHLDVKIQIHSEDGGKEEGDAILEDCRIITSSMISTH
jgi:hypothetical protein